MSATTGADRRGFTIIELMIATIVFSLVLLVAVSSFLQIGRMFYKGFTSNQTQIGARQVLSQITADMQDNFDISDIQNQPPNSEFTYFCVGNKRYTLNFDMQVDTTEADYSLKKFGILRDEMPGNSGCAEPCYSGSNADTDCDGAEVALNSPKELLAAGMSFRSEPAQMLKKAALAGEQLYNVNVRLVYGDDDVLTIVDTAQPATGKNVRCDSNLRQSQFCAEAEVSSVIFAGEYGP